jgi:hypothetical protein
MVRGFLDIVMNFFFFFLFVDFGWRGIGGVLLGL